MPGRSHRPLGAARASRRGGCMLLAAVLLAAAAAPARPLTLAGWITGLPTTAGPGFVLPLSLDGAIQGWVVNLDDPTSPLRLAFAVGGTHVGSVNASGIFYNDARPPSVPPPAPRLLRAAFTFFLPDAVLDGTNASLAITATATDRGSSAAAPAVAKASGAGGGGGGGGSGGGGGVPVTTATASAPFTPGNIPGGLHVHLRPRLSPYAPTVGSGCLGEARCPSRGDALSFGSPWFDEPTGWADETPAGQDLFKRWNCSAPSGGVDTIVRLNILPYARRDGAAPNSPGNRYHHRGFKKDSVHLAEDERDQWGGPVLHFSAARHGIPGAPGAALGRAAQTASVWSLKKAIFNRTADRWQIFDQLDAPASSYGVSSYDGVDGVNMIANDGGAVGWGPTATCRPSPAAAAGALGPVTQQQQQQQQPPQLCRIPGIAAEPVPNDYGVPSFPLVGTGPLGLTTVQEYFNASSTGGAAAGGVADRCVHMNPKLAEFDAEGVPGVMWAYLWSGSPDHGCTLPDGRYVRAGYYAYRPAKNSIGNHNHSNATATTTTTTTTTSSSSSSSSSNNNNNNNNNNNDNDDNDNDDNDDNDDDSDNNSDTGWQLDVAQGLAEFNMTRGQAMKKEWGAAQQTSFIYSCWDLPPLDVPPSTIFRVDTTWPAPRHGQPLLQCFGGGPGDHVHLGEPTGNATDLYFLVDTDPQAAASHAVGEAFAADIYYAFRKADRPWEAGRAARAARAAAQSRRGAGCP